jgi:predicted RNA binding protein YcfA (HicA-like mRNA interferase family)
MNSVIELWDVPVGNGIEAEGRSTHSDRDVDRSLLIGSYVTIGLAPELGYAFEYMPKKIRELKQILRKYGFTEIAGKGSHTNWTHPSYSGKLTISGQDSADAKRYQEKDVSLAIQAVEEANTVEEDNEIDEDEV